MNATELKPALRICGEFTLVRKPELPFGWRAGGFAVYAGLLFVGFSPVLWDLARYAANNDLHSHIFLVPVISAYLIWTRRRNLPRSSEGSIGWGLVGLMIGGAVMTGFWIARAHGWEPGMNDYLSVTLSALICFLGAGVVGFLGAEVLRRYAFPCLFLIFLVPLPSIVTHGVEITLQQASAGLLGPLFQLSGTPVLREGTSFYLKGLTLEVAPECSGIRATFVLFITGLVAGNMFLKSGRKRLLLALLTLPLGVMRNALRVFAIAMLTIYVDPAIIDGPVHNQGGPVFFILSLAPFLGILWVLRKLEGNGGKQEATGNP